MNLAIIISIILSLSLYDAKNFVLNINSNRFLSESHGPEWRNYENSANFYNLGALIRA